MIEESTLQAHSKKLFQGALAMQNQTQQNSATTPAHLPSPAIQRLIEEVRNKEAIQAVGGKYDRTHNRHNRGQ